MTDQVNEAVADRLRAVYVEAHDAEQASLEATGHAFDPYLPVDAGIRAVLREAQARPSRGVVDAGAILAKLCKRYIANSNAIGKYDFVKTVSQDGRLADSELGRLWLHALQAAALPAVPSVPEGMVLVRHADLSLAAQMLTWGWTGDGLGCSEEQQIERMQAQLFEIVDATPAHDQPEGEG